MKAGRQLLDYRLAGPVGAQEEVTDLCPTGQDAVLLFAIVNIINTLDSCFLLLQRYFVLRMNNKSLLNTWPTLPLKGPK